MKQRVLFGLVDQFRKDRLDTRVRDSCYRESRHCRMPLRDFCHANGCTEGAVIPQMITGREAACTYYSCASAVRAKCFDFPLPLRRLTNWLRGGLQVVGRPALDSRLYSRLPGCSWIPSKLASKQTHAALGHGPTMRFRRAAKRYEPRFVHCCD